MKKTILSVVGLGAMVVSLSLSAWALGISSLPPALAASGSRVYAAWTAQVSGSSALFFRRSLNRGATWKPVVRLTYSGSPFQAVMAVSGSSIYIAYGDTNQVWLAKSPNGGAGWLAPVQLSNASYFATTPAIAASGSGVYVFWDQYDGSSYRTYYTRSANGGGTWDTPQPFYSASGYRYGARVAAEGLAVIVVWTENGTEIDSIRSLDGGATWQDYAPVSSGVYLESIDSAAGTVGLAWTAISGSFTQVFFGRSGDGGVSWAPGLQISDNSGNCFTPRLAHSGGDYYAVWEDPPVLAGQVFFTKSSDTGQSWKESVPLTSDLRSSTGATVTASGSNVYVAYWDSVPADYGFRVTLVLSKSLDRGMTWKKPKKIGRADIIL
jgi:hypothetical protein